MGNGMKQAAQINEQLVTGKCSINEAREKCGLIGE